MAVYPVNIHRLNMLITGTLFMQREGDPSTEKWVYQRTAKGLGNIPYNEHHDLQLRSHVIPYDPKTAPQLARRSLFANAVEGWQSLSAQQKQSYNAMAKNRQYSGYNYYIKFFMEHDGDI